MSTAAIDPEPLATIFDVVEYADLLAAAAERGVHPVQLVRTVVLDDLHR